MKKTKKINLSRRVLAGEKVYEKITRQCLSCRKVFVGFKGVDFMCQVCKKKDHD